MRILILNWRDIKNPSSGGAEVLTHEMAKRWVSWGHQVTQISSSFPKSKPEELVDGVRIIRRGNPDTRHLFTSIHFLAFLYYLREAQGKFDVVIDEVHGIPFFTPWYVKEKKIVLICEVAGDLWQKTFGQIDGVIGFLIEKFYLHYLYRNISFLTISQSTKKDLIIHGVKEKYITVLPMGITLPDRWPVHKKEQSPTLLFVGRLIKTKGIEDVIMAFQKVYKKLPKARLWIVGRGSEQYENYLKERMKDLGIYKYATFFGFVSESEKFSLMRRAHILLHSSLREGFGLTIPEAGIVQTPVIGYNSSGLRDIIKHNKNGILLTNNTFQALAKETLSLLSNRTKYKRLSKNAFAMAQQYNWDKTANAALEIMQKV